MNLLKKAHVTQRPTPAQPCLTVSEDRELDIAVQRIIHTEIVIREMIKEMKKYLETIKQLDRVDQSLTINLSSSGIIHFNDEFRKIVEDYHSVTTQVGRTVAETVNNLQKTFIEPLRKLRNEFVYIKDALAKREELVHKWNIAYTNLRKYQEKRDKTATIHVKIERERKLEEAISKELKIYHSKLVAELPMFLEKRLEYLKPTLNALIAIQLEYYGDSTKMFTQLMPIANAKDSPSSAMIAEEQFQQSINAQFSKIRNLTIIKND